MNASNTPEKMTEYKEKITAMTDMDLLKECEDRIWLSAYAHNNPQSCYHWQVKSCYDECERRGRNDIYERAYQIAREM